MSFKNYYLESGVSKEERIQGLKSLNTQTMFDSMSDDELLDAYKDEFDKLFIDEANVSKLRMLTSALKKRGLEDQATAYAFHKTHLEQ